MNIRVLEFKTEYKGSKSTDWVLIAPIGENFDKVQTWLRINEIRPPEHVDDVMANSPSYQTMLSRWAAVSRAYDAWKSETALPEDGTPLAAWQGVTPEQAAVLRRMGAHTVENVAALGEQAVSGLPWPGARRLPQLAKEYLAGATAAEKDAEIQTMRERMAAMEELIAEMAAAKAEDAPKRGPGRPRKEEAEAA